MSRLASTTIVIALAMLTLASTVLAQRPEENPAAVDLVRQIEATSPAASRLARCRASSNDPGLTLDSEGRVTSARLVEEVFGFAREAATTGGLGKRLIRVTTTADYDPKRPETAIAGSLRQAVDRATRENGAWILFDPSLGNQARIDLLAGLRLPSNVTIDGGCSDVTITANTDDTTFDIFAKNIIIARLAMRKRGAPITRNTGDCITIARDFDAIYIAHNDFGSCTDGQIDITSPEPRGQPRRVTVAFNRFADHNESMLADATECEPSAGKCTDPLAMAQGPAPELLLTLHANLFLRTAQRHPRIAGSVYVHAVNNVIAFENFREPDGTVGSAYGIFVGIGGRLLAENDVIFQIRRYTQNVPLAIWTSASPQALRMPDPPGAVVARNIRTTGHEVVSASREERVASPPYRIADALDFERLSMNTAIRCIADRAGREGSNAWLPDCRP